MSDGRLDILSGGVDIAIQRELDGDYRGALGVGRTDRSHARDRRKFTFQGRRDRGCHRFRVRAGLHRRNLNRGIVHAGQRRDRQRTKADDSEKQNRERHERRHNRAFDEDT